MMSVSERVFHAMRGEKTDLVPCTTYNAFSDYFDDIESLIRRGMGVVYVTSSVKLWMDNVEVSTTEAVKDGCKLIRTTYSTPVGEVYSVKELMPFNTYNGWIREYLFKTPDDYKVLQYMYEHQRFTENYDFVRSLQAKLGEGYVLRDTVPLEPLQQFITADVLDCTTFAMEWYDNRDEIMKLYEANACFHERLYETIAKGPLGFANYGGNVIPQIIGPDVFRDMYIPYYNMAADVFHASGKLLGTHLDADNTPIMDLIGQTKLDYIEAYDPSISPSLTVAKEKFGDKAIWINWPSGEHYRLEQAAEITRELVDGYGDSGGLLVGVTENLPGEKWDSVMHAILDGLSYPR